MNGSIFEADGDHLPKEDGISLDEKFTQARQYWQGNQSNIIAEVLVNGRIEVAEIIEEYS